MANKRGGLVLVVLGLLLIGFHLIPIVSATPFVSTWNTSAVSSGSSNSTTISLPLLSGGNYNFTVDWGDGNQNNVTNGTSIFSNHTYASAGVYQINITANNATGIVGFRFMDTRDKLKIINILQWGDLNLGNSGYYFQGCSNLNISATDILNTTGTTSMSHAFESALSITNIPNMGNWDMSNVTDMSYMFETASSFNQNISGWNTSRVTNMRGMFLQDSSFNQSIGNWDTSNVTDMDQMFEFSTFNQPIGSWNTSKVTDISYMFYNDGAFNQPIGNWDTSKVTTMAAMFYSDSVFNQNIDNWNTSKVTSMSMMFGVDSVFKQNLSNWDTHKVTDMSWMFMSASQFNGNITGWNTSNVVNMNQMFDAASLFNQNLGSWDTHNVTDMSYMFNHATTFNQPIGNWDTSKVTNMAIMFNAATAFNQNLSNWNVSSVTDMHDMFKFDTLTTANYESILIGWASLPKLKNNTVFNGGSSRYTSADATNARNTILIGTYNWTITDGGFLDTTYPIFSNYNDNNATLVNFGVGIFNVTLTNTNGTVLLSINGVNVTTTNLSANVYNATYNFTTNGTYSYKWVSWGNGTNHNYNISSTRSYTVNYTDTIYPSFSNYNDNNATISGSGTAEFNATVANTNGSVWLSIDGANYTATNLTSNVYNVSLTLSSGTYNYTWNSYGSGASNLYNNSQTNYYTVNAGVAASPATSSSGGGGGSSCMTKWNCTEWSSCINSIQTRTCSYPNGVCKPETNKPIENQSCVETKSGGKIDNSEKPTSQTESPQEKTNSNAVNDNGVTLNKNQLNLENRNLYLIYGLIVLIILVILIIIFILFFKKRKKKMKRKKSHRRDK